MAQWTHIAATFRIDGYYGNPSIEEIYEKFGKRIPSIHLEEEKIAKMLGLHPFVDFEEIVKTKEYEKLIENYENLYNEYEDHPENFIPSCDSGSLDISIWENPDPCHMARCCVSAFGDLVDCGSSEDIDQIRNWFKKVCNSFMIRQAICNVDVEFFGSYVFSCVNDVYHEEFYKVYEERKPF